MSSPRRAGQRAIRRSKEAVRKLCGAYFGKPRQDGTSHAVYKTPWPGDPRVNIQGAKGMAKPYQVRQVLRAIEQLAQMGKGKS